MRWHARDCGSGCPSPSRGRIRRRRSMHAGHEWWKKKETPASLPQLQHNSTLERALLQYRPPATRVRVPLCSFIPSPHSLQMPPGHSGKKGHDVSRRASSALPLQHGLLIPPKVATSRFVSTAGEPMVIPQRSHLDSAITASTMSSRASRPAGAFEKQPPHGRLPWPTLDTQMMFRLREAPAARQDKKGGYTSHRCEVFVCGCRRRKGRKS